MILHKEIIVSTELVDQLESESHEGGELLERISQYLSKHFIYDFDIRISLGTRKAQCSITNIVTDCKLVWLYCLD